MTLEDLINEFWYDWKDIDNKYYTPELSKAIRQWIDENVSKLNDGKCYVCGEETNSLVGNPSLWGFYLPNIDGQGKHRHYHIKCLYPILRQSLGEE